MNKKTFTLAVIFLICALGWLGANVYWRVTRSNCVNVFDLVVGVLFVAADARAMITGTYQMSPPSATATRQAETRVPMKNTTAMTA